MSTVEVRRNDALSRYELLVGGDLVGRATYEESGADGKTLVFPHTVIDPEHRGQGLGAQLVKGALDDVRASGRRVVPRCWYVAAFIDEHPDYADLLER
jgi:predicted GNAT family acetyltransferase